MTIAKDKTFGFELSESGKLEWFSYVLDDFEAYIEAYWTKTQSGKWDDVTVLPESFRIDYIDNQFDEDWDVEFERRAEAENEGSDDVVCFTDLNHVNAFEVKNTPENLEKIKEETGCMVHSWTIWDEEGDDDSVIHVETLAIWTWVYYSRTFYSDEIKENFCMDTGIDMEDIQEEDINVNG